MLERGIARHSWLIQALAVAIHGFGAGCGLRATGRYLPVARHDAPARDYAGPSRHLIAAVFTPWIAVGIALLIGFFASYLTALSWADLTYVLPATAFGNVIVALLARFWLHDTISLERWAGIVLITVGVGFVAQGPSLTEQACASKAERGAGAMTISSPALNPALGRQPP